MHNTFKNQSNIHRELFILHTFSGCGSNIRNHSAFLKVTFPAKIFSVFSTLSGHTCASKIILYFGGCNISCRLLWEQGSSVSRVPTPTARGYILEDHASLSQNTESILCILYKCSTLND